MEDFIRMNLNGFLCSLGAFIVGVISFILIINRIPKEYKKLGWTVGMILMAFLGLAVGMSTLKQASVNNIPRKSIDRSYTNEYQKNYQSTITKE